MKTFNQKYQLTKRISPEVIIFYGAQLAGNVRELENLIEPGGDYCR